MSISPTCAVKSCGKEIDEPGGAIILSPPRYEGRVQEVIKTHICRDCYQDLIDTIGVAQ
jgi:hypothetical protein